MSTLHQVLVLWLALGSVGLLWWADRVMDQMDDELSAFARAGDLQPGA